MHGTTLINPCSNFEKSMYKLGTYMYQFWQIHVQIRDIHVSKLTITFNYLGKFMYQWWQFHQFHSTLFKILVKLQLGFGREIYVTSLTNPCYNFYISCNNLDNSNHSIQHKQGEVAWTQHLCRPGSHQSSLNKRRNWRKDGQDNATIPSDLCPIKRSIFALLVQFQGRGNKTAERVLSISQRLM